MKKTVLALTVLMCALGTARADEGMWLIQSLNRALEKNMKERGLKLGAREIYNEEAGCIADAVVSLGFFCTGSMISDEGLMITNHHCAYSHVAALSTPEHNYLEDGFWAQSRADEIPIQGAPVYFLRKVLDVTDEVLALQAQLQAEGKPSGFRRLSSIIEKKYADGDRLVSMASVWGGDMYYVCIYDEYKDVRLVSAPPVTVAAFGGDEDNWEWPQHKADFAIYRVYDNDGKPLKPRRKLTISTQGYTQGDFTMVIGYPGRTDRYAPAAEMNEDTYVVSPVENRLRAGQMAIIRKWMDQDPDIRRKYANHFFSLSNTAELKEGQVQSMKRFAVVEHRREEEKAMTQAASLIDSLNCMFSEYAHVEEQKAYYRECLVRSMILGQTLMRMGGFGRGNVEQQRKLLAQGLAQTDARVEKDLLAFSLKEFISHMDEEYLRPVHLELRQRFGTDYEAMAQWVWDHSCLAGFGEMPNADVVARFDGPIGQDMLYRYIRELNVVDLNSKEDGVTLNELRRRYARERHRYLDAKGVLQYPDANSTMRLSYGQVGPMKPWDGVYTHWQSTARGLREKYDPGKYDYAYPTVWKYLLPPPDFPVNFLTDNDITGGNSGSPVLNARGELIGLAFDGNKESLASNYEAVPGYNMCVCVDIRYVLWVIQYLGRQDYILQEIG